MTNSERPDDCHCEDCGGELTHHTTTLVFRYTPLSVVYDLALLAVLFAGVYVCRHC